jgi:hypothetical protein
LEKFSIACCTAVNAKVCVTVPTLAAAEEEEEAAGEEADEEADEEQPLSAASPAAAMAGMYTRARSFMMTSV